MKTICYVGTKGGTGKTSLAFATGLEAAKHGSVYFVDADPQKSLTELCHRREVKGKDLFEDNPSLLEDVGSLVSAVETLKRTGFGRDFIVADTPGSMMPVIRDAIAAADCVVLPIQESPLDIFAQEDAVQYILEAGKKDVAFFVMNRIDPSSNVKDFVARISPIFPNPPVKIAQRLIYARALIKGPSLKTNPLKKYRNFGRPSKKFSGRVKSMKGISLLTGAQKSLGRDADDRSQAEIRAQAPDGHARRKSGRLHQILWRATDAKKAQLQRLADRLSIGQLQPVSYTITMERALDALERELKGTSK